MLAFKYTYSQTPKHTDTLEHTQIHMLIHTYTSKKWTQVLTSKYTQRHMLRRVFSGGNQCDTPLSSAHSYDVMGMAAIDN